MERTQNFEQRVVFYMEWEVYGYLSVSSTLECGQSRGWKYHKRIWESYKKIDEKDWVLNMILERDSRIVECLHYIEKRQILGQG